MKTVKKLTIAASLMMALAACGGNSSSEKAPESGTEGGATTTSTVDITKDPNYAKGLEIEAKNDCGTCHKINEKLTGPSFHEIAERYANADEATIDSLAAKVIRGGAGNWGQVPMTPHPNLSQEDAKTVVKYVLLMKNA
ncbi:c-type cytochrome [Paraflavisolibacter sp. H34]|uniref:c-type cytochrome n=1 Tax=Huijunlia imazamoxiresistens TaxID=3127457 RepID=UPI0030192964